MQDAKDIYTNAISRMPPSERLRLAALILSGLTQEPEAAIPPPRSALELLESLPEARLYKTSAEADVYLREERDACER